jgi:curved DNA-binding protein CbpA
MLKDLEAIREDPYKVLGGSRTDSDSEIRKKFINLAKKCHTDKIIGDPDVEKIYKENYADSQRSVRYT